MTRLFFYSLAILASSALTAHSATITITTADGNGADAEVLGHTGWIDVGFKTTATAYYGKAYVRFELPNNIGTITHAELRLFRSNPGGFSENRTFNIYGLLEASDYGTGRLDEEWAENTITWNNAPGNSTATTSGTNANLLDANTLFLYSHTRNIQTTGSFVSNDTGAKTTALIDFLTNEDTNGLVTFILRADANLSNNSTFTTKEYADWISPNTPTAGWHGPVLYLEYEPLENSEIPEPATLSLLAIASVVLLPMAYARRRRKLA